MTKEQKIYVCFFALLAFFLLGLLLSIINLISQIVKSKKKKRRDLVTQTDLDLCVYSFLGSIAFLTIWWIES